jgi:hypothetical protein
MVRELAGMLGLGCAGVAMFVLACSDEPASGSRFNAGTGGAGGAGALAGTGGIGAISGTGGTGGTGGAGATGGTGGIFTDPTEGWTNPDHGPVPAQTACTRSLTVVTGQLEGQSFAHGYRYQSPWLHTFDQNWYADLLFFGIGQLFTQAAFPDLFFDPPDDFVPGQTYPLGGWLLFGDEAPAPGRIYCIEPGSMLTPGEPYEEDSFYTSQRLDLHLMLSVLGQCPGTPVEGSLTWCDSTSTTCTDGITGSVDGRTVDTTIDSAPGVADEAGMYDARTFIFDGSWLRARYPSNGPIGFGLFIRGPDFERTPSIVYCMDEGTATAVDDRSRRISVTRLSKLGACAPGQTAAGQLQVCTVEDL